MSKETEETAVEWSLRTWQERHDKGYFPTSIQHHDWYVYPSPPKWFAEYAAPTPDDVVCEIGAGYGEWMIPIAPTVTEICGFDIAPNLVSMAAAKFAEHGADNARMCMGDGTSIPFARESFSLVYSISVFQHIPGRWSTGISGRLTGFCGRVAGLSCTSATLTTWAHTRLRPLIFRPGTRGTFPAAGPLTRWRRRAGPCGQSSAW